MPLSNVDEEAIGEALAQWRQGDVCLASDLDFLHMADLSRPHSPASCQAAETMTRNEEAIPSGAVAVADEVRGFAILTQTCDLVRDRWKRPFVEVAPLIEMPEHDVEAVRRLKRPAFAYVPALAPCGLVADLDRVMTVEKAIVAGWKRTRGCRTDRELRDFAQALSRKRSRWAFPDDFIIWTQHFVKYLIDKHNKNTDEGDHIRALYEIRVRATPSWDENFVNLDWWFIEERDPKNKNWELFMKKWRFLIKSHNRFRISCFDSFNLDDLTARDYVESDGLDLDRLST